MLKSQALCQGHWGVGWHQRELRVCQETGHSVKALSLTARDVFVAVPFPPLMPHSHLCYTCHVGWTQNTRSAAPPKQHHLEKLSLH